MSNTTHIPSAMSFYHADGLVPAWKQALRFAGNGGRIATMQDVTDLRLAADLDSFAWNRYFTTSSAEYFGRSRGGSWIIIVAHGVGPMATLDGACATYKYQFADKTRQSSGGRITQQQFWDLEAGKYGEVHVVDFKALLGRYRYTLLETLTEEQALVEPLLKARFGARSEAYIRHHAKLAIKWYAQEQGIGGAVNPFIITMGGNSNLAYGFKDMEPRVEGGLAYAHLLSVGGLQPTNFSGCDARYPRYPCLVTDISCHGWNDGTRLIGVQRRSQLNTLHQGVDNMSALMAKHWRKLLKVVPQPRPIGFRQLMQLGKDWFTTVPKKGERMDSFVPEYHVQSIVPVGPPKKFTTTIGGYHGLLKYGLKEVEAIKPPEANGYTIPGEVGIVWKDGNPTHHTMMVQFYRVDADVQHRMMKEAEILADHDLLMSLLFAKDLPATVESRSAESVPA